MQTTILPAAAAMALGVGSACAFEARARGQLSQAETANPSAPAIAASG